ncbi:MAG: hypothetical protein OXE46_14500 [Chloroflexi bacterium]|nr:hypothetical protein [Chloroflexota bacterium]
MSRELERIDILLRIIVAAQGDAVSPVQLQKVAFLVGQECPNDVPSDYYEFVPYDYGPFCKDIYQDVEELERRGHISISPSALGTRKEYRATFRSRDIEFSHMPAPVAEYIAKAVEWAKPLSFGELVSAIYQVYPAYATNSIYNG